MYEGACIKKTPVYAGVLNYLKKKIKV